MWQIINDFTGNILGAIGVFLFAKILLNTPIKVTKRRLIIDFILSIISYTIIMIHFTGTIKTLLMVTTVYAFIKDIFKENNKRTIFLSFIYIILLIIPDIFILYFVTDFLGLSKEFCHKVFAGSIIGNITTQLLLLSITIILKQILRRIIKAEISNNNKIILLSIITITCIIMFFHVFTKEFIINGNSIPYLLAIIVFSIILFSLIKQTIDNYRLTNEYDKLLEFMTTYENEIENQRILRHEVKNEFRTIKAKICDNQENKEIIEYIDEIVKDKYEVNKEKYPLME